MNLLEAQIEEFIRSGEDNRAQNDREFNSLAVQLFHFQLGANPAYANFVSTVHEEYHVISRWEEIPPLPITAFRQAAITTFPIDEARVIFHSSGTTDAERSSHYFKDLRFYELSVVQGWPSRPQKPIRIIAFSPTASDASDSSLVRMFQILMENFGDDESGFTQDPAALASELKHAESKGLSLLLLGTAISLNNFLNHCESEKLSFRFDNKLLIMETGGFKGHRESIPPALFYRRLGGVLGTPSSSILSEYSMSEISSQFYNKPGGEDRSFQAPPWVRWRLVHPLSGEPVPVGNQGVLEIFDLANVHSAMAIRTDDVGRATAHGGFSLEGRVARAPRKGCSLSV